MARPEASGRTAFPVRTHLFAGGAEILMLILALVLVAAVLPAAAAQETVDSLPSLSVVATSDSPYVYRDSDGLVAVAGEVENRNPITAVSEVVVRATFYGDGGEIREVVRGTTLLNIVPSGGTSPYLVRSASDDPGISQVSIDVESFDSSPDSLAGLEVSITGTSNAGDIEIYGTVHNRSGVPSGAAEAHVLFYDVFEPPRLLQVETVPIGGIPAGGSVPFEYAGPFNERAAGFRVLAESGVLVSAPATAKVPPRTDLPPARMVNILDVEAGAGGAEAGSEVVIESALRFLPAAGDRLQPFVYLVQVKQLGEPLVEFVGAYEGAFYGSPSETASVAWIPERPGNYFVETFVWDDSSVALAPPGPTALVRVN